MPHYKTIQNILTSPHLPLFISLLVGIVKLEAIGESLQFVLRLQKRNIECFDSLEQKLGFNKTESGVEEF